MGQRRDAFTVKSISEIEQILHMQLNKGWSKELDRSSPVFSLISHKTLNNAGFIRWQLSACFLSRKNKHGDFRFHGNLPVSACGHDVHFNQRKQICVSQVPSLSTANLANHSITVSGAKRVCLLMSSLFYGRQISWLINRFTFSYVWHMNWSSRVQKMFRERHLFFYLCILT